MFDFNVIYREASVWVRITTVTLTNGNGNGGI